MCICYLICLLMRSLSYLSCKTACYANTPGPHLREHALASLPQLRAASPFARAASMSGIVIWYSPPYCVLPAPERTLSRQETSIKSTRHCFEFSISTSVHSRKTYHFLLMGIDGLKDNLHFLETHHLGDCPEK